ATAALLDRLADPDKAVRQAATFALGRIGPENPSFVAAALLKRYAEEKEPELRREAVVSLKLVGDRSEATVAGLTAALGDADADTQAAAVVALASLGPAGKGAADALLKLAGDREKAPTGLRVDAVRAFGSVLGPDVKGRVAALIEVMAADPAFEVRVAAVEEVGALGPAVKDDPTTMTALRKRLSDPQVKVRAAAAAAIKRTEKKPEKPAEKKP
ncbi:MAG: HEAT repeat domain-containing protein, partial [Gemmataceae bacterium]|nr:HEAT repeat domain-containing protein [Gemmataceae bacterium]